MQVFVRFGLLLLLLPALAHAQERTYTLPEVTIASRRVKAQRVMPVVWGKGLIYAERVAPGKVSAVLLGLVLGDTTHRDGPPLRLRAFAVQIQVPPAYFPSVYHMYKGWQDTLTQRPGREVPLPPYTMAFYGERVVFQFDTPLEVGSGGLFLAVEATDRTAELPTPRNAGYTSGYRLLYARNSVRRIEWRGGPGLPWIALQQKWKPLFVVF